MEPLPVIGTHLDLLTPDRVLFVDWPHARLGGFLLAGGLHPVPPGLEPIAEAKLHLGRGAVRWLQRRLRNGI
jgi:hypothetical protein